MRFAGPHIFADQMRLGNGHVELGRGLCGIRGGVFDDETLRPGAVLPGVPARAGRARLQPHIPSDAVLEMNHQIAILQIGEVNLEGRPRRLGMGGLEPARALNLLASEHLGVGDHHDSSSFPEEPARERAHMQGRVDVGSRPGCAHTLFGPNLLESSALALVVAHHVDLQSPSHPTVHLLKELATLDLPDFRAGRLLQVGTKGVQGLQLRTGGFTRCILPGGGRAEIRHVVLDQAHQKLGAAADGFLQGFPSDEERIGRCELGGILGGMIGQAVGFAQQPERLVREMFQQCAGHVGNALLNRLTQQPELAAGREGDFLDPFPGDLGDRIEVPQRVQVIPEELEPHRPGMGQRENVQNAAAQRELPLLIDLRFGFVSLVLEPFHQIQRIDSIAPPEAALSVSDRLRAEGALEQGGDIGDDGLWRARSGRKGCQGFQPFADHIRMGQRGFVGQNLPVRKEQRIGSPGRLGRREQGEPGADILIEEFLCATVVGNQDNAMVGKTALEQGGDERLRGRGQPREQRQFPLLHAPGEVLHGGRLRKGREQRFRGRARRAFRQGR